ncbi:Lrp/AsnC family transcriptional regulator [Croceicoccus sp. Ery15]|uniref:Lrp/AsnC family transcriptional regulator n=1 Tax=Croceicoccus sp. Ery15 TaxID=1703338 RepID=UPI001E632E1B|nr:Lrp/AsnC family transcriptional regulator [Croceicoccus sp. Ery15]
MPSAKSDLDGFDLHLLELLQRDSRQPVAALAEAVGLSPPACYRRIRRLRETGAIEGEVAIVKPTTLGWNLSVLVTVTLDREDGPTIRDLMTKIVSHSQVVDCANVTGEIDLIVRMVARDMEHYDDAAIELFATDERVRSFKTFVVIREMHSTATSLK